MRVDFTRLPHWPRVTFAARCARRVQPLLADAWPDAAPNRVAAVEQAIALAERSAAERRACEGLTTAVIAATAGRALMPYPVPMTAAGDELSPTDADAALVASFAAKVAAKAAEAAATDDARSDSLAHEAFYFALDAIHAAGRPGLVEVLEADFEMVGGAIPRKPWWRAW